ncbi:MAG: 3-deoxy-7-phosphoheptulonate synthase [Phycisphaerae bacterium]|nr:3-deoxy-7-phosphoheptulonate synthase [Phycisphaerae bacterium]
MLVILKSHAQQEAIDHVVERIESLGLKTHISQGEFKTIIGAIGEESPELQEQLATIDGVERVMPIMKPYKLAGREMRPNDSMVQVGDVKIGCGNYAFIAGPCAVEDFDTCMDTAKIVKKAGANMLRGGAYKPRTSPYAFQGLGEEGLKILKACREETGLPVVTEVTDPRNVDLICEYADMLQIGARNMQNFVLLTEVGKAGKPVLLKRGANATVKDWLMSAEYILSNGNENVVLCERGSTGFEPELRFNLDVGAIALAQIYSHLPIIVDPSHPAGRRDLVRPLCMAGMAAGADGFITEVHSCPEKALCDGKQALTGKLIAELIQQVQRFIDHK